MVFARSGSYSLLKKNRLQRIFIGSNGVLDEFFDISQKDVMNSITNDKSREQALSKTYSRKIMQDCLFLIKS